MNGNRYDDIVSAYKGEKAGKYSDEYKAKYGTSSSSGSSSSSSSSGSSHYTKRVIDSPTSGSGKLTPLADSIIDWTKPIKVVDSIVSDISPKESYREPSKGTAEYDILKTVGFIKEQKTVQEVVEIAKKEKSGIPIWMWAIGLVLGWKVVT